MTFLRLFLLSVLLCALLLLPVTVRAAGREVFVQTSHSLMATRAVFSPDGQRIAVCDGAGRVALWDAPSGRKVRELTRHTGLCLGLAYFANGAALASAGGPRSANEINWHRARDGELLATLHGHQGAVREIALSRDGKTLWSLGENDGLKQWALPASVDAAPTAEQRPMREIAMAGMALADTPNADLAGLALDPKSDRLWVARTDGKVLEVDYSTVATVEPPRVKLLWQAPDRIAGIAVSPQGDLLAVTFGGLMGAKERAVMLVATATGQVTANLLAPKLEKLGVTPGVAPGVTLSAAFSPDGERIVAVSMVDFQTVLSGPSSALQPQETVTVWSRTGAVLAHTTKAGRVNGLPFVATQVRFDRKGERIAVAAWDINPRIYTLNRGQLALTHTLEGRGLAARLLASPHNAPLLVTADAQPGNTRSTITITPDEIRREFGNDADWSVEREQRLKAVYGKGANTAHLDRASVWNLVSGRLERVVGWQRAPVTHLAVNAADEVVSYAPVFPSTVLLSPLKSNLVREARLNVNERDGTFKLNHFDPDPAANNVMDVFHAAAGSAELKGAGAMHTTRVVASRSGRWVALAMQPTELGANPKRIGHKLMLMEQQSGVYTRRVALDLPGEVRAAAVSANERRLWLICGVAGAAYQSDYEAILIALDLPSDTQAASRAGEWALRRGATPDALVVSADGERAFTSGEPEVPAWIVGNAEPLARYAASPDSRAVTALALSDDGARLIAADVTGHISAWDTGASRQLWARRMQGPAPQVLGYTSGDTRIAAAASDGTIHLIEAENGEPVARMIRFDNEEWITILPEGYFVASQHGDRWLNVRVDDTVYGIDQFFDVFYRPDIVERRLAGQPIKELITVTLDDALRNPPPIATVEARQSGGRARVRFSARSSGGKVGEVRVFHNGKLIATRNGTLHGAPSRVMEERIDGELDSPLVPGENLFAVIAFNGANTLNAKPVTHELRADNLPAMPRRVVVLSMGINEYVPQSNVDALQYAVKDANDLSRQLGGALKALDADTEVVYVDLRDTAATKAGLMRAFDQLTRELRPTDMFVWIVASHGTLDATQQYGIIPHDWDGKLTANTLISAGDILDASRRLPPLTQFFIFDTCHSGGLNSLARGLYDARLAVLARNMGLHIFASASAAEEAIDGYKGNGLFTHMLLQGLRTGAADADGDNYITIGELGRYAGIETPKIARMLYQRENIRDRTQQPIIMNYGKDWTVQRVAAEASGPVR